MARLDAATPLVAVLAATMALFLPHQGAYSLFQILVICAYPSSTPSRPESRPQECLDGADDQAAEWVTN